MVIEDLSKTFLDASVYIKLEELVTTETALESICKHRNNVPLLKIKNNYPQLVSAAQEVADFYNSFMQLKVILTPGVCEQLKYKPNLFLELEEGLRRRLHEYLFIQIDGMFSTDFRKQATEVFGDCLKPYQDMIRWMDDVRENSPYKPSPYFEAINDYVGGINYWLNLLGNGQKYDTGIDQKLAAAILDNIIVGEEKIKLLSNDSGLIKLTEMSYLLLKSASVLMHNNSRFDHQGEAQLELYCLNNQGIIEQKELSENLDDSAQIKLFGEKNFIHTRNPNNPKLSGYLADFTLKLLRKLKI